MSMSWEEFLKYVSQFVELSDKLNDGWKCVKYEEIPGGLYVTKKVVTTGCVTGDKDVFNSRISGVDEMTMEDDEDSDFKDSYSCVKVQNMLTWEYHIMYSISYGVPVLYFNIWDSGGKLIGIEEIWNGLEAYPQALQEKWQFITQQEHPILRRPYYQFHPCKTAQLMENFKQSSMNPLVTWLSTISPFVHLHLPSDYGKLCTKEDDEHCKNQSKT